MAEQVRDITADRADIGAFQLDPGQVPQLVKPERAVDPELILVDLAKLLLLRIEFVLNIADHFLEHILQRHHSDRAAVFVDHDGEMRVSGEEKIKQFLERHHFRHRDQIRAGSASDPAADRASSAPVP